MIDKVIIDSVIAIIAVVASALSAVVIGFIVMLMWNLSLATIFTGVPEISYVQGALLYILTSTLFKSSSTSGS